MIPPLLPYHVTLLGRLKIRPDGDREFPAAISRFRTQKTAALFAFLCCAPSQRKHSREELAERFWPDTDSEAARVSLRAALAALRRQLEPPGVTPGSVLIADRWHVWINPDAVRVDVRHFEAEARLSRSGSSHLERQAARERAQTLYEGDLLPGSFEEWVLEERERLRAIYEDLLEDPLGPVRRVREAPETGLPTQISAGSQAESRTTPHSPAASSVRTRLPLTLTSFRGRQGEIIQLLNYLLPDKSSAIPDTAMLPRLITLIGAGGMGKTRLAIETGRRCAQAMLSVFAPAFPGGVFFVPLVDVQEGHALLRFVAAALEVETPPNGDYLTAIAEALNGAGDSGTIPTSARTLLILDNLEHLLDSGAAEAILALLSRISGVTLIATSRRRLAIPGERLFPVEPLSVPNRDTDSPEEIAAYPGVQVFVDRAQEVRPDFQVTRANAATIAGVCRELEGLPLALELVAARAHTLTPARIASQLTEGRWVLTSDQRRSSRRTERHRSLQAAIAWSVDLLPQDLARFWTTLSLFRGGCTAEAAAAVSGDSQALERITQLRERSLVVTEDPSPGGDMRFRLLETLREFASERFEACFTDSERTDLRQRYITYYREWAMGLPLKGAGQAVGLAHAGDDWGNLRHVLEMLAETTDGILDELTLLVHLYDFFYLRGHVPEGRRLCEAALERATQSATGRPDIELTCVRLLNTTALLAIWALDLDTAERFLNESLKRARAGGYDLNIANALNNLGMVAKRRGDVTRAEALYSEFLALCQCLGRDLGIADAHNNLGNLALNRNDWPAAREHFQKALPLYRGLRYMSHVAMALMMLGNVALREKDFLLAESYCIESLPLRRELGDNNGAARTLLSLAHIRKEQERWQDAARLIGASDNARHASGIGWESQESNIRTQLIEALHNELGESLYEISYAEGHDAGDDELLRAKFPSE